MSERERRLAGLPAEVAEAVERAECVRCGVKIVDIPTLTGVVFVNYQVPALGVHDRRILCSACGLLFREFLQPELKDDELFQYAAGELRKHHL